jgi:thiol-disulfide isomerase/thioredoxin
MNEYLVGYLTFCYDGSRINGMDEIFVKMATNYFLKDQTYWKDTFVFDRMQMRVTDALPLLNGNKMPTLILQDKDGDWHSVQDGQGKFTIVVFWDPDCKHCQKEIPVLKEYYNRVHMNGVDVFAVNIATEKEIWTKYLEENQLDWTNVADLNRQFNLFKTFDIVSYPQFFLLDKDKNIVAKKIDLESIIRMLDDKLSSR